LSTQPSRSYLVIASAILIAGVLISASVFVAIGGMKPTVTTTVTTTSIATCTDRTSNATNAFSTDCNLGITLGVAATPEVLAGRNETFYVSVTNDMTKGTTFNYTSLPTLPNGPALSSVAATVDMFPPPPICGYPSLGNYVPAYIVIYNGAGVPVQLTDSAIATVSCLHGTGYSLSFNASETITEDLSIGGVWTSTDANQPWINATYSHFSPGSYAVVAFDAWGQLAELNFSVVLSPNADYLTAGTICTGPGGYAPCFGGSMPNNTPYFFNCAAAAATPQGCTERVTYAGAPLISPAPSYVINIRYPFTNQTAPWWANCVWTVQGITPGQEYGYCMSVNSTSFALGEPTPPPVSG
jgi:hypothetical protein